MALWPISTKVVSRMFLRSRFKNVLKMHVVFNATYVAVFYRVY